MNASATPPDTRASDSQTASIERTLSIPQTGLLKFVLPVPWVALAAYAVGGYGRDPKRCSIPTRASAQLL